MKTFFLIFAVSFTLGAMPAPFTVVLDPGTGREPALLQESLACTELLRQALEDTFPEVRIVLSRTSAIAPDINQAASFSNRLHADLHVAFNFAITKEESRYVQLYTCGQKAHMTPGKHPKSNLTFIPFGKAYTKEINRSQHLAHHLVSALKATSSLSCNEPHVLPLKALQGVLAPSFLIELPLTKPHDWRSYFSALHEGLKAVIQEQLKEQE